MRTGTIIAILLSILGLSAMVVAFISSASPYVTIAEARALKGDNLHIAGDIVSGSLFNSGSRQETRFTLRDAEGQQLAVVYAGSAPANMGSASKVVAIGAFENGVLKAHRLLIKCPSKYESKPGVAPYSAKP